MLVPMKVLLEAAEAGNYAIGAFNVMNMEIVEAALMAAEAEQAPIILQVTQTSTDYTNIRTVHAIIEEIASRTWLPIATNLDHGKSFDWAVRFIRAGFTSVMIDGSKFSFDENVALTQKVIEAAHACGVSVEAELGVLGALADMTEEEKAAALTKPEDAARFVELTGVDALAVSIGTKHGPYKGKPELAFDRLAEINAATDCPLVMHGGTGVPDEHVQQGISLGIRKINIDTQIRQGFRAGIDKALAEDAKVYDPRKLLIPARDAMVEAIRDRIQCFGTSGKGKHALDVATRSHVAFPELVEKVSDPSDPGQE